MQPQKLDKIVKAYRVISQIPALVGAKLTNSEVLINTYWSQRNIEKGKTTKFLRCIFISRDLNKAGAISPVDISYELLSSVSPSETYRAVLRESDDKQFLEVWSEQNLIRTVDLNALELHGNVYTEGDFAAFEWSPDEKKLLYVAERKIKKSEPFYKRKGKPDTRNSGSGDESPTKGEEYLYRQDWGEQLVGRKKSILAEYNLETDTVEVLEGVPECICPACPVYAPDGSYIVGIAYRTEPRKLGLVVCSNRSSTLFSLDFKGNYVELNLKDAAVKSPRFTPDGNNLIWLQRKEGGPHASAMSLMKTNSPLEAESTPNTVVDIVRNAVKTTNGNNFYGLYNVDFPKRCWASNNRLFLSTNQRNSINSYVINIGNGDITELEFPKGSQIVLDVHKDIVLVNQRNFLVPDVLAIGKVPENGSESCIEWIGLTENITLPELGPCGFKYLDVVQPTDDSTKLSSAIYVGPTSGPDKQTPLIIWPHGGPHGASGNYFHLECALFMTLGYGILLVNYRGSIGAGQDGVEYLLGKIGSSDVSDCILATQTALKEFACLSMDKLFLVGGSHGGFLVTHLSGQYPDMFKAVVARNPVIDVASMSIISDIPDWSYVETGSSYTQKGQPSDDDLLLKMRQCSPIEHAHKVKAPTLLQIGSKDMRVPMHQGVEYYHRLKANGVCVRMNLYDDKHQLGSVPNEMDNIINTALWLEEHRAD